MLLFRCKDDAWKHKVLYMQSTDDARLEAAADRYSVT
jgi:hypothetical protein